MIINFVTLTNISSEDKKPMIVLKEYYYYSFGDMEIRYPNFLNNKELEKIGFEKSEYDISFFKYIGENNTDYEIYIRSKIGRIGKSIDLTLITVKKYKIPEEIDFGEIEESLYNENLIKLRRNVLKIFVEKCIENSQGGTSDYYKLPLIYCMVENCNIGVGEDKRLLTWDEEFKNERNIGEGPYSVQNENGQIIVWKNLENYGICGEENIDNFLYIVNAYRRESSYGGGFNVDKTFMRDIIEALVVTYAKDYNRDLELLSEKSLSIDFNTDFIKKDTIAKWSVIPYLFARYRDYHLLYDFDNNYFEHSFDYISQQTKMKFECIFNQEKFKGESDELKLVIIHQIENMCNEMKERNKNYKDISKIFHLKIKNFDSIYLVIIAFYGIIIGIILKSKDRIKKFWKSIPKHEKKVLSIIFLTLIIYITVYDLIVIYRIMFVESSSPLNYTLVKNNEKSYMLFFSFVIAVFTIPLASYSIGNRFWKWVLKKNILKMVLYTILFYILLYSLFLICGFIFRNSAILLFSLILAIVYIYHRKIINNFSVSFK